jgi:hypothetical protein
MSMKNSMISRRFGLWLFPLLFVGMLALFPLSAHSATITIVNGNAAGIGLNDPTPVAPVGGNPGTTLGAQRLNALQYAADIWGAKLTSSVPIKILVTFEALSCTVTSAVFGSAGATEVWSSATYPIADTWYPVALADKLSAVDLDPSTADIRARYNVNLGQSGCLDGTFFYLGLDNNHGTNIDLVTKALHDFAHGLGFGTYTSRSSGAYIGGLPSIEDHFIYDLTISKAWSEMTNAERAASAVNPRKVVWTGAYVTAQVPAVLTLGTPQLQISSPSSIAGAYMVGAASFGPVLSSPGVTGEVMPIVSLACAPLSGADALAANGKLVLIDRGTCTFAAKVKNAQVAGAIGVMIANNAVGGPPSGLGGADPTITIPSVMITQADGNTLKNALKYRSRTHSGVFANLGVNMAQYAGADDQDRMFLFTPNPFQSESSVNSWDTSVSPSLLMEPDISADLTHNVDAPHDLTLYLLKDIGW